MIEASPVVLQTQAYWNHRYAADGTSGPGSIGLSRAWKWGVIQRHCPDYERASLVDIGCGDLTFWQNRRFPQSYVGIDMSDVIVERNQAKHGSPHVQFICSRADQRQPISGKIVFCFDVLFHVLDEQQYKSILENLCAYTGDYLFVFTWLRNPFRDVAILANLLRRLKFGDMFTGYFSNHDRYQMYRDFSLYLPIFESRGLHLDSIEVPGLINPYGAMMIFRSHSPK